MTQQNVKNQKHISCLSELHCEVSLMNLSLKNLIEDLPTLSRNQKEGLLTCTTELWDNPAVRMSVNERLRGSQDAFENIMNSLLKALDNLISEKSLGLTDSHPVSSL